MVLGHTRLSIIDVEGGHQPITNEDGSVVVVYNGEIWNYPALRRQLVGVGPHVPDADSDTEVLVHGYEEWADASSTARRDVRVRALGCRRERCCSLATASARSRSSSSLTESGLAFGSDARSVHLVTGRQPTIATEHVAEFIFQRYVISPRTLFSGVERLAPAHRATYDREALGISRYWAVTVPTEPVEVTPHEIRELLRERPNDA